jgi:hypothetical protein
MISSCAECTNRCCYNGPGPYKKVPFDSWYDNSTKPQGYNTMCEDYDEESGKCSIWKSKTKGLPIACIVFVCGNRSYTEKELADITAMRKRMGM